MSNIFTGCMLMFTQPFSPGEKIFLGLEKDYGKWGSVAYKVKTVGWYNTVLEGKDTRPVYIPNSFFATTQVVNISRNTHRIFRHDFFVSLRRHADVPRLQARIMEGLTMNPKVDVGYKRPRVHLRSISPNGLMFTIEFHFGERRKYQYLELQQEVLCMIAESVEDLGGRFERPRADLVSPNDQGYWLSAGDMELDGEEEGHGGSARVAQTVDMREARKRLPQGAAKSAKSRVASDDELDWGVDSQGSM